MFFAFLTCPDGEWGTPVALTTDDPVTSPDEPCVESFGPRPLRRPLDSFVLLDHFLSEFSDSDEPLVCGSRNKGGLAAPAMWIRVFDCLLSEEQSPSFEILDDYRVCFSDLESGVLSCLRGEVS